MLVMANTTTKKAGTASRTRTPKNDPAVDAAVEAITSGEATFESVVVDLLSAPSKRPAKRGAKGRDADLEFVPGVGTTLPAKRAAKSAPAKSPAKGDGLPSLSNRHRLVLAFVVEQARPVTGREVKAGVPGATSLSSALNVLVAKGYLARTGERGTFKATALAGQAIPAPAKSARKGTARKGGAK